MRFFEKLNTFDLGAIKFLQKISNPLARIALFIVFFWFGLLKVLEVSPAGPLVESLHGMTVSFIPFHGFFIAFGLFEMLIGVLFLIPRAERAAIACLIPHMISTALPLVLLPSHTWAGPFLPTMEGQYILKNVAIVALAFSIAAKLGPMKILQTKLAVASATQEKTTTL